MTKITIEKVETPRGERYTALIHETRELIERVTLLQLLSHLAHRARLGDTSLD